MLYGLVVSVPIGVAPAKNCTWLTVPSESLALADTVMAAPAANDAPLAGAVKLTVGGVLAGPDESKKKPLTTALPGPVLVIRNVTCPEMAQTKNWPPEKLAIVRVSSTALVSAFSTSIRWERPRLS